MSDALTYLKQVIRDDSEQATTDALAIRRKRRSSSKDSKSIGATKAVRTVRADVELALAGVAEQLFSAPARELGSRLADLDATDYPDLARWSARLQSVAAARREIDAAADHPKTDEKLYLCTLKVLGKTQPEGAEFKRHFLTHLRAGKRRRGAQASVKLWRREFPALFALEADWFGQVLRVKSILGARKKPAAVGLFFVLWVVLKVVREMLSDG